MLALRQIGEDEWGFEYARLTQREWDRFYDVLDMWNSGSRGNISKSDQGYRRLLSDYPEFINVYHDREGSQLSRKKLPPRIRYRNPERVIRVCLWCRERIPPDSEVFSLNAKIRPGVQLREQKGIDLYVFTADRVVSAIVVANDSQAKREGKDLAFPLCSQDCAESLKMALQTELDLVDSVGL